MSSVAVARVPTSSAGKYLQQVCKHWTHNLKVEFDATKGTIVFPKDGRGGPWAGDGLVTLTAHGDALECRIAASELAQLSGLKGALARHIDRFAFREAPLTYNWQDVE